MLLLTFLACAEPYRGDIDNAELYTVGDSILDWFVGQGSVPEVVGETLDRSVYNAAIAGSHFLDDEGIPAQYQDGPWGWLIMDGGANDLNDRCRCGDCDDVLDSILSEDGTQTVRVSLHPLANLGHDRRDRRSAPACNAVQRQDASPDLGC